MGRIVALDRSSGLKALPGCRALAVQEFHVKPVTAELPVRAGVAIETMLVFSLPRIVRKCSLGKCSPDGDRTAAARLGTVDHNVACTPCSARGICNVPGTCWRS